MTVRNWLTTLGFGAFIWSVAAVSEPLGTDFTFQGELQSGGAEINGQVQFEFEAFDAGAGGNSLAPPESRTLNLTDGLFTTVLDFGDTPFLGEAVWLEVRVRQGGGNFTTLLPRQSITSTPYALHAQFVGMDAVSSSEISDGSIRSADLADSSVGSSKINSNQVQRRISSSCPVGSAIRGVASNGSVTCQAPQADDDWLALGDGRVENTTGVVVEPAGDTPFALTVRHNSSISAPTAALVESEEDFARLSFYSDPNPSFWTIAARNLATAAESELNFFNSVVGNIMTIRGNRRVGIRNTNPQSTLHVSGGDVRVDALSHSNPEPTAVFVDAAGTLVPDPRASRYFSIPAEAFHTNNRSIDSRIFASVVFSQELSGSLAAPVQLRDGDVLEEMIVYFRDESPSRDLIINLLSGGLGGNGASVISRITTSGASASFRSASAAVTSFNATIDNLSNRYFIQVLPSSTWTTSFDLGIQAVVLRYR